MWDYVDTIRVGYAQGASQPATVAELRSYCRVVNSQDDAFLQTLLAAAIEHCESNFVAPRRTNFKTHYANDSVLSDRYTYRVAFELPFYPLVSITDVKVRLQPEGAQTTLDAAKYDFLEDRRLLKIEDISDYTDVEVNYLAGYDDADRPAKLKLGLLAYVNQHYESREGMATVADTLVEAIDEYGRRFDSLNGVRRVQSW